MCRVFQFEVVESPETLEAFLKREKDVRQRERLQFLYWYKTGQAKTRQALGKLLDRSQFAIGQWIGTYRTRKRWGQVLPFAMEKVTDLLSGGGPLCLTKCCSRPR